MTGSTLLSTPSLKRFTTLVVLFIGIWRSESQNTSYTYRDLLERRNLVLGPQDVQCGQWTDIRSAYDHINSVVSVDWLKNHLHAIDDFDGRLILLEVSQLSSNESYYEIEHISGAIFFNMTKCATGSEIYPMAVPTEDCFQAYLRDLGIQPYSAVVVCAREYLTVAARAWWTFRLFGHDRVAVLDARWFHWKDNLPLTSVLPKQLPKSSFKTNLNYALYHDIQQMLLNLEKNVETVVDSRSEILFEGEMETKIGGHIEGSLNIPLGSFYNDNEKFKNATELLQVFTAAGVNLSRPIVATSFMGMSATVVALAAHIVGMSDVAVYYGSFYEWSELLGHDFISYGVN